MRVRGTLRKGALGALRLVVAIGEDNLWNKIGTESDTFHAAFFLSPIDTTNHQALPFLRVLLIYKGTPLDALVDPFLGGLHTSAT